MTDHANELRRYSRKIAHPAGDVPSVMLAAADEIERLAAMLEAAEKERDECNRRRLEAADHFAAQTALMKKKYDDLRVKVAEMEQQEPVALVKWQVGGLVVHLIGDAKPGDLFYTLPGAQSAPSVPDGWQLVPIEPTDEMLRAIRAQRSGARKGKGDRADWKAWLAAAPEVKP